MEHYTRNGQVKWDSAGFDSVHQKLLSEGYYEPLRRLRGMPAPKEFPKSAPPVLPQNATPAPNVPDADERARLKTMDLNELAKLARAGYSKNPYDKRVL